MGGMARVFFRHVYDMASSVMKAKQRWRPRGEWYFPKSLHSSAHRDGHEDVLYLRLQVLETTHGKVDFGAPF
jgi:hypothetical protein